MEKFIVQIVSQLGSPSDVGIPDRKNDSVALRDIANLVFVSKAKNGIIYSVVGLIVVWCAFVVTNYVAGRFN